MIPSRYFIDSDTNLAMNTPNQWSISPYLGAVWDKGYNCFRAQIKIPVKVWETVILNNQSKWKTAPKSLTQHKHYFALVSRNHKDPRVAAWIAQKVLYSDDVDPAEVIEDYLEMKYLGGLGDIWLSIVNQAPVFDNEPLTSNDCETYFSQFDKKTRDNIKTIRKNAELFESRMTKAVKREFDNLKESIISKEDIDSIIELYGIEYFLTSPTSVKIKDLSVLQYPVVI